MKLEDTLDPTKIDKLKKELREKELFEIANMVFASWPKPYFGAVPYLKAMQNLTSIEDNFLFDSGRSIVVYFLANATTWRGPVARLVKAELNRRLNKK